MSQTREYIVSLQRNINYDHFWTEMENPTSGLPCVPNRAVDIVNNRSLLGSENKFLFQPFNSAIQLRISGS